MEEKGIEDAIRAVSEINKEANKHVFELDIYGPVDDSYVEQFKRLELNFPSFIRYKGIVPFNESVQILKKYYLLLFPTHFFTEGIPGTILDSFAAGVPVIAARWESFNDVINEGNEGLGYQFGDYEEFKNILKKAGENLDFVGNMKENCLNKAKKFRPEAIITTFLNEIEN